jgi:hypothetical protein
VATALLLFGCRFFFPGVLYKDVANLDVEVDMGSKELLILGAAEEVAMAEDV